MDKIASDAAAPAEWIEALAESEADISAGRTVSSEAGFALARASLDRMEARRSAGANKPASGGTARCVGA